MKIGKSLLLGVAGAALMSTAAMAADLPMTVVAPSAPAPAAAPAFSWAGAYAGVFGGYDFSLFPVGMQVGAQFGYNFVMGGRFLAGIEVETTYNPVFVTIPDANLNVRLGATMGDRLLIYGQAGIGSWVWVPAWLVGGGIELAVGHSMSVFVEADAQFAMGGGYLGTRVEAGMNYHPGGSMGAMAAGNGPFEGLYYGVVGGFTTAPVSLGDFGVQVGYNMAMGRFVGGFEIETKHHFPGFGAVIDAGVNAHLGLVMGDRFLVYGEGGVGTVFAGVPVWNVGGGVEVALNNGLSVFGEAKAQFGVGGGGYFGTRIAGGVNMHVGR